MPEVTKTTQQPLQPLQQQSQAVATPKSNTITDVAKTTINSASQRPSQPVLLTTTPSVDFTQEPKDTDLSSDSKSSEDSRIKNVVAQGKGVINDSGKDDASCKTSCKNSSCVVM